MTNGREAPFPFFTTEGGRYIRYRQLSPDTLALLQQAVARDLAADKPEAPTQPLETAPGEFVDVPNTNDPDYVRLLAEWEQQQTVEVGKRFQKLMETYALIYDVDQDAVNDLRVSYQAVGIDLASETDTQVYLWRILLPTPTDQTNLMHKLMGRQVEEAIKAQQATFRRDVAGQRRVVVEGAEGQSPLQSDPPLA